MDMLIDLHAHLLPGVDDGAQTVEDSLALGRLAVREGIEHLVVTPHHRNGHYINHAEEVIVRTQELQDLYNREGVGLTVYPGQEIRINEGFLDDLYNRDLLSLDGGGKYYLIEFPTMEVPDYTWSLFEDLVGQGITPVIAHPERNKVLREDYSVLAELIEIGALGQVTAVSYSGSIGPDFLKTAQDMIRLGLVHLVSSDAHSVDWRPFNMQSAYSRLRDEFGEDMYAYFTDNARRIINGDPVVTREIDASVRGGSGRGGGRGAIGSGRGAGAGSAGGSQNRRHSDTQGGRRQRNKKKKRFFGLF